MMAEKSESRIKSAASMATSEPPAMATQRRLASELGNHSLEKKKTSVKKHMSKTLSITSIACHRNGTSLRLQLFHNLKFLLGRCSGKKQSHRRQVLASIATSVMPIKSEPLRNKTSHFRTRAPINFGLVLSH